MPLHTFPKSERMVSTKDIELLFSSPESQFLGGWPLRAVYRETDHGEEPLMVLISVSKRHLRNAVDRNRAKRQVREAWRLNKDILICAAEGPKPVARTLHIAFLWLADELQESELIQRKMRNLLHRIAEEINAGDLNNRS